MNKREALNRAQGVALKQGVLEHLQNAERTCDRVEIMRSFIRGVESRDRMARAELVGGGAGLAFYERYVPFASDALGVPADRVRFMLLRNANACLGCVGDEYPAGTDVEVVNLLLLHKDVLRPLQAGGTDDELAQTFERAKTIVSINLVVDDPDAELRALSSMRPEVGAAEFAARVARLSDAQVADHRQRLTDPALRPVLTTAAMRSHCELPVMPDE